MEKNSTADSTSSASFLSQERIEGSWYPIYFGVSCALFAVRILSGHHDSEEEKKWSETCNKMLQGSAQLLGLLVWRANRVIADNKKCFLVEKLEAAEKKIAELNRIRREDAKANEKVVCIFAAQEQSWFNERKKLRQQIGALINEIKIIEKKNVEDVSKWNEKLKEMEILLEAKDKSLEEAEVKSKELEENLKKAERALEDSREAARTEIWKQKTAFIELVSNQRQLEAEMGRAMRQIEALKEELTSVLEQKEESVVMVQKFSVEVVKMQKDLDQKDKILSAMLRKSKLDTAEKQMLLKEVKFSKSKRKQAELEKERLRLISESNNKLKHGGNRSLRSILEKKMSLKLEEGLFSGARKVHSSASGSSHKSHNITEGTGRDIDSPPLSDTYSPEENGTQAIMDNVELDNWVQSEAEKYAALIEQRHLLEMDAFVEQMGLKDEKLETCRWRLLSMDIESKRLRAHVEGLNKEVSQLRHSNMKLEALLLEREEELKSLKEKLASQFAQNSLLADWSKVKIIKRRASVKGKERKLNTSVTEVSRDDNGEMEGKDVNVVVPSPEKKIKVEKDVVGENSPIREESSADLDYPVENLESSSQVLSVKAKDSSSLWRMDLQALGVSYKIKRLKQQLLMLERLMGKQGSSTENMEWKEDGVKSFLSLISMLNKHIGRYQSLQEKTDDLCKRMHENHLDMDHGDLNASGIKGEKTKTLEHFLEETFQLQRYMVATGQKLMEVQSKVAVGFVGADQVLEKPLSFDTKRFADNVRTLFQEVQRGLEVRISRIIGDLEGTLASDGITHIRR
ncbi:CAP-Gly domain-containing linker protein 1 [Punica granatum]|uniref:CAP-Gly domain-containing linker protein 1 n=1 Tax=Punica granatum TaxID=22663 RepID=A0A6P8DE21_PUNGR|nr:CAP-Gly domain-containing linker protein 1 [Punica granatum]XP_031392725.1 CAP-Gly domain-containing linker protein 1 [Punica granatum]XP_031392726.1 CAP-Gly domain-containing linker protein 1 [Punica granatum]